MLTNTHISNCIVINDVLKQKFVTDNPLSSLSPVYMCHVHAQLEKHLNTMTNMDIKANTQMYIDVFGVKFHNVGQGEAKLI